MPSKTIYAILATAALAAAAPAQESGLVTADLSTRDLAGYKFNDCRSVDLSLLVYTNVKPEIVNGTQACLDHCADAEWFGVGLGFCWCDATAKFLDIVNNGPNPGQCSRQCDDRSGNTCGGFDKRNNVVLISSYLKKNRS